MPATERVVVRTSRAEKAALRTRAVAAGLSMGGVYPPPRRGSRR